MVIKRLGSLRAALAIGIAALSLFAFYWTFNDYYESTGNRFLAIKQVTQFYTHWAMLTFALSFAIISSDRSERVVSFLIGNSLILIMIMTIMYVVIKGIHGFIDSSLRLKLEHAVIPSLIILYWTFFGPTSGMKRIDPVLWTSQPIIYTLYTLVRGARSGVYPYDIANAGKHGYTFVLSLVAMITVASVLTGYGILYINNRLLLRSRSVSRRDDSHLMA